MSNRLSGETSPYLLQHKDNPVHWHPWGEAAFSAARSEGKPIFLSIGYAACHWCHVMAHESFEDPETAALLNEHFIAIKVDREERPDIDATYMDAVVAMTGQGGWPMSVFLTPEAKPFYAGTYFPPTRRHGLPAFREVLLAVANAWRSDRPRLLEAAALMGQQLATPIPLAAAEGALDPAVLAKAREVLVQTHDPSYGGWGGAPKFPQAAAIEFLLRQHARDGDPLALEVACHTLRQMCRGGIYDAVGGGFHRYAVDASWHIPHFEKMLYDNALLSRTYLHAWQVSGEAEFRQVAESTLDFLLAELRHPLGGFFSSLDADSEGQEGRYYVWTADEIRAALGSADHTALFAAAFGVSESGDLDGANVLHRVRDDAALASEFDVSKEAARDLLGRALQRLRRRRAERIPPARDEKVLTCWNGLALASFAEAGRALQHKGYLQAAQMLADSLLNNLQRDGQLYRSWSEGALRQRAFLEDHAALAEGLLALYTADFDLRWYAAAAQQAEEILTHFAAPDGGFYDTRSEHATPITRRKGLLDNPIPSGNAMAVAVLLHLAALTGEPRYTAAAEAPLRALQHEFARHPLAFGAWLCALDFAIGPQQQLAIAGDPRSSTFQALAQEAARRFLPRMVIAGGPPDQPGAPPLLQGRTAPPGGAAAYLCQAFTCRLPAESAAALSAQLREAA